MGADRGSLHSITQELISPSYRRTGSMYLQRQHIHSAQQFVCSDLAFDLEVTQMVTWERMGD